MTDRPQLDQATVRVGEPVQVTALTPQEIQTIVVNTHAFVRDHPSEESWMGPIPYEPIALMLEREKIDPALGRRFDAHGIAKGSYRDQVTSLLRLLEHGIDETKPFHSVSLRLSDDDETAIAGAMGSKGPYDNGGFIVISGPDSSLRKGIKGVLVNEHFYGAIPTLQTAFPEVRFIKAEDMSAKLGEWANQTQGQ